MFIDPADLETNLDIVEEIEKASMRLVTQAIVEFRDMARTIFYEESDLAGDIGEDITREALDKMGMSKINVRLYGKIDYKKARYFFHPQYAIKQALFVDSKAEKADLSTATIQTAQTSMRIIFYRGHGDESVLVDEQGTLLKIVEKEGERLLSTIIFVKYNYREDITKRKYLDRITIAAIPNGLLQVRYNPNADDTIWRVGRHAETLGEAFRVRLVFNKLKQKQRWRTQIVLMSPNPFQWTE